MPTFLLSLSPGPMQSTRVRAPMSNLQPVWFFISYLRKMHIFRANAVDLFWVNRISRWTTHLEAQAAQAGVLQPVRRFVVDDEEDSGGELRARRRRCRRLCQVRRRRRWIRRRRVRCSRRWICGSDGGTPGSVKFLELQDGSGISEPDIKHRPLVIGERWGRRW